PTAPPAPCPNAARRTSSSAWAETNRRLTRHRARLARADRADARATDDCATTTLHATDCSAANGRTAATTDCLSAADLSCVAMCTRTDTTARAAADLCSTATAAD